MNKPEDHIDDNSGHHEAFIKTPKQLIVTVILGFLVPIVIMILLIRFVVSGYQVSTGSDALSPEAIATRLKPVADFVLVDADAPKVLQTGQQVYESTCSSCHAAGVAGAPKFGDKADWAPLIDSGYDTMLDIALNGKGAMPARGGNTALSDLEVERALVYMANASGASFDEPADTEDNTKEAAAAAEAAASTAAAPAPEKPAQEQAEPAPEKAATETAAADTSEQSAATIDPAGEKLYKSICFACHDSGLAGAPKFGDKEIWAPLIASGMDTMVEIAIHGKGAMPPRGGSQATDDEVRAAVQYMVQAAQ